MKTLNSNLPNLQETPSDWLAENPQHPAATWHTASDHWHLSLRDQQANQHCITLPLTGKYGISTTGTWWFYSCDDEWQRARRRCNADGYGHHVQSAVLEIKSWHLKRTMLISSLARWLRATSLSFQQVQKNHENSIPALALNIIPTQLEPTPTFGYLLYLPSKRLLKQRNTCLLKATNTHWFWPEGTPWWSCWSKRLKKSGRNSCNNDVAISFFSTNANPNAMWIKYSVYKRANSASRKWITCLT